MTNIEVLIGDNKPVETTLYEDVHEAIKKQVGRMTPAQINGILFQIQLEVLDVFGTDEYTA